MCFGFILMLCPACSTIFSRFKQVTGSQVLHTVSDQPDKAIQNWNQNRLPSDEVTAVLPDSDKQQFTLLEWQKEPNDRSSNNILSY